MTEDEINAAFRRATSDIADDMYAAEDAVYVEKAREMEQDLPPEIRERVENAVLLTPSMIRKNPEMLMQELVVTKMENDELLTRYHAARRVLAAVARMHGVDLGEHGVRLWVTDEALTEAPPCVDMSMESDPAHNGFLLTFTAHDCDEDE